MNDSDDVEFNVTSLDHLSESDLEAIVDKVLASEEGATAMRTVMKPALATALRSMVKPSPPSED